MGEGGGGLRPSPPAPGSGGPIPPTAAPAPPGVPFHYFDQRAAVIYSVLLSNAALVGPIGAHPPPPPSSIGPRHGPLIQSARRHGDRVGAAPPSAGFSRSILRVFLIRGSNCALRPVSCPPPPASSSVPHPPTTCARAGVGIHDKWHALLLIHVVCPHPVALYGPDCDQGVSVTPARCSAHLRVCTTGRREGIA